MRTKAFKAHEDYCGTPAHNNSFIFWCQENSDQYHQALAGSWGDAQNWWGLASWKLFIGQTTLGSAARGSATNYVVNTASQKNVPAPSRWPLMWDFELAPNLPSYYWISDYYSEVQPRWLRKHMQGYNCLYLDGHARSFADNGRTIPASYPCQGKPGNQNSWGVLRLKEYFAK